MRFSRSLMPLLALAASLSLVSGCASKGPQSPFFPDPVDLVVEPKPVLPAEAVESEALGIAHDIAVEARGDRLAAQVARLCRFFGDMGMKGLECPPPDVPPRPG
jgi:hypothetical protein